MKWIYFTKSVHCPETKLNNVCKTAQDALKQHPVETD